MKKYVKPEMTVIELKHKSQLLVGSVMSLRNSYYEDTNPDDGYDEQL